MKKKWIEDGIYGYHFWLVWDCSYDDVKKFYCKQFGDTEFSSKTDNPYGSVLQHPESGVVLYIEKKRWSNNEKLTLDHELHHLHFYALDRIGISLNEETKEVFAYYFQYLKRKIIKALK